MNAALCAPAIAGFPPAGPSGSRRKHQPHPWSFPARPNQHGGDGETESRSRPGGSWGPGFRAHDSTAVYPPNKPRRAGSVALPMMETGKLRHTASRSPQPRGLVMDRAGNPTRASALASHSNFWAAPPSPCRHRGPPRSDAHGADAAGTPPKPAWEREAPPGPGPRGHRAERPAHLLAWLHTHTHTRLAASAQ